tara:strand:+ start:5314 stop:6105 length:792 start_codon:yes stop_codon:yes gene_type:complete
MISDQEFWGLYIPCAFAHGYFDFPINKTVELGNTSFGAGFGLPWMEKTRYSAMTQDIFYPLTKVPHPENKTEIDVRKYKLSVPTAQWYHKTNREYLAIDINGQHRSLNHDLQNEITDECPKNYYEILLDFGTIEHVKKQYMAWKNCHNLVKDGGLMIHSLPSSREGSWIDHCYHWYTLGFFEELALKCKYDIRLLDEVRVLSKESDYQIWACLRKTELSEFISEEEFLKIMNLHVSSEYGPKNNGKSRHGVPPEIDISEFGDI